MPDGVYELAAMLYNLVGHRKLTRAMRSFRPHFLYERYSLFTTCGVRAARRQGIPHILEVNAPLAMEQENEGKLVFRARARATERWIASNSTRTIVVSTPMKRIFVELGVPADHIEVVKNGVDPDHFHGRDTGGEVRARHGLEGRRVLGFVGWIREWHGLVELATAMGTWGEEMADVHLMIVGDGPARAAVEEAASRAGVPDRVHITGPVDRAAMPDHVAAFDIALQPAATPYASPMKVFEYLAMGKPVIACRQENLEEILREGEDALFFEPGDPADLARAARELLSDPVRLERMSAAARESIREHGYLWRENAARAVRMALDAMREDRLTAET
jgi:glycosyltransferase involved in cell wall biosynthesis